MSHTVRYRNGAETHVDQQADVAVTDIVNSYPLHAGRFCAAIHLMIQIAFGKRKDSVFLSNSIQHIQVILHFVAKECWHLDRSDTFLRFGRSDIIFSMQPLIRFVDGHGAVLKVEVFRRQGQQFALTNTALVQHFECVV